MSMQRIDAGTSGSATVLPEIAIANLELDSFWQRLLETACPEGLLRPVQASALLEKRILENRRNFVVCAPSNSGKSLVGYFFLLESLRLGRRAVLLEPLRALAREKAEELDELLRALEWPQCEKPPRVRLTTGDYRLQAEQFQDPPPESGELIVATTERLDAILRNNDFHPWIESIGSVVVDEAHLISNAHRGPTLEFVLASLQLLPAPPRICLLSATIGEPERLASWLTPCDLVQLKSRFPELRKEIIAVSENEDVDTTVRAEIQSIFKCERSSVLVFVYQRASTTALAAKINEMNGDGIPVAVAYNSGLSSSARSQIRKDYTSGKVRCIVTTTALALGVNLPATHVIIRDSTFPGVGKLGMDDIIQMLGRAGRGKAPGKGAVIVRAHDGWAAAELASELRDERLVPIRSSFVDSRRHRVREAKFLQAAELCAAVLARHDDGGCNSEELRIYASKLFGGHEFAALIDECLDWLTSSSKLLAYKDADGRYRLTVLGRTGVFSRLPLNLVAGLGQLLRDLMCTDAEDTYLRKWTPVDTLFTACLLGDSTPVIRRFSQELVSSVDVWFEASPQSQKPLLYREWVAGSEESSRADELLGSLGITFPPRVAFERKVKAREKAYVALFHAAFLMDRGGGRSLDDLRRRWGISPTAPLDGIEESWRDTMLWLLGGIGKLLDVRTFYYHLKERCQADRDRIQRVKKVLAGMRGQVYDLQVRLSYCSPLSPVLRGVRGMLASNDGPIIGERTIRKLEEAGFRSIQDLQNVGIKELTALGVRPGFAKQIRAYVNRRLS